MAKSYPYRSPAYAELRRQALELAAAAVTAGSVHQYDVDMLAGVYFDFLANGPAEREDDHDEPPTEAVVTRKAKH